MWIYHDGIRAADIQRKWPRVHNPNTMGNIVLNKIWADRNGGYSSFEVDELLFFNRTLTKTEIRTFNQNAAWETSTRRIILHLYGKVELFCVNKFVPFYYSATVVLTHRSQSGLTKYINVYSKKYDPNLFQNNYSDFINCSQDGLWPRCEMWIILWNFFMLCWMWCRWLKLTLLRKVIFVVHFIWY